MIFPRCKYLVLSLRKKLSHLLVDFHRMTTSTATSVVLFDELPDAFLCPDVEGVAGADERDLLAEDLVVQPVEEVVDTGLGAGLKEEGSGAGFDVLAFVIFSYSLNVSSLNFLHLLFPFFISCFNASDHSFGIRRGHRDSSEILIPWSMCSWILFQYRYET